MSLGSKNLKRLELILLAAGLILAGYAAFTYFGGRVYSRVATARFNDESSSQHRNTAGGPNSANPVDYSLWSEKRIKEYEATLAEQFDAPLGILRVEKIRLEVPIFDGTDDRVLNRGVGRIIGTARIGAIGKRRNRRPSRRVFPRLEGRRRWRHHGNANRHRQADVRDRLHQDS